MRPKPDAQTYYKTLNHTRKASEAHSKAMEARKALEKLGLPQVNRITASKSDGSSSRR